MGKPELLGSPGFTIPFAPMPRNEQIRVTRGLSMVTPLSMSPRTRQRAP